jgi:hypothetical protein
LLLRHQWWRPKGAGENHAKVGIYYNAPKTGRIRITAEVAIAGADVLWFVNAPVLNSAAEVSVESWAEVTATHLRSLETITGSNKFRDRFRTSLDELISSDLVSALEFILRGGKSIPAP